MTIMKSFNLSKKPKYKNSNLNQKNKIKQKTFNIKP